MPPTLTHTAQKIDKSSVKQNHGKDKKSVITNSASRQVLKRQRERVYLAHFLAVSGLFPVRIISGSDDGQEPDFTCVFYKNAKWYYIGIELTTLPRLRDRLGNEGLMLKRWYWQLVKWLPLGMGKWLMRWADGQASDTATIDSVITQADIDAVMAKKASKVTAYKQRRQLDEVWLLIHTNEQQENGRLVLGNEPLHHHSDFDSVVLTLYPNQTPRQISH